MKQLELCLDGTIIIRNRTDEWHLDRPTLGEYRRLVELAEAADQRLRTAIDGADDAEARVDVSHALQLGPEPLYGSLVRAFIEQLAPGDPPDVDDLPSWAVSGAVVARMITHWRAVPLDLGPDG